MAYGSDFAVTPFSNTETRPTVWIWWDSVNPSFHVRHGKEEGFSSDSVADSVSPAFVPLPKRDWHAKPACPAGGPP